MAIRMTVIVTAVSTAIRARAVMMALAEGGAPRRRLQVPDSRLRTTVMVRFAKTG